MKNKYLNKTETILRQGALLTLLLGTLQVHGAPIMGPVLRVEGDATYQEPGTKEFIPLREHDRVRAGGTIQTHSHALFSPMPGAAVQLEGDGQLTIQKLDRVLERGQLKSRETALKLDRGSLAFAIEDMKASDTAFQVETPRGTLLGRTTSGAVTLGADELEVVICDGAVTFRPATGAPVALSPGSVFTAFESGAVATRIVNLLNATVTLIHRDGVTNSGPATPEQVQTARASFQSSASAALASANTVASRGLMSSVASRRIEGLLGRVNQSPDTDTVEVAAATVSTAPVGSSSRSRAFSLMAWPEVANPANTSGPVASPEQ